MSRVGRSPIPVPSGVTVTLSGDTVQVKGPQGSLERQIPEPITIAQEGDTLVVSRPDDERHNRALHGLSRSLVANMVSGVTNGFTKELEIVGVGYRATARGPGALELALGFSHPVAVDAPEGITFEVPGADEDHRQGDRQGEGGPGGRRHPQAAQARALQGQGRALRQRTGVAQGWKGGEVMARTSDRSRLRLRRHDRVRTKVHGTPERPRLAVHRSNRHISAQLIDDTTGHTLAAASSVEPELRASLGKSGGGNVTGAESVGHLLGSRAKAAGITKVVFDRGGFVYHGRVAVLADAARAEGLEF